MEVAATAAAAVVNIVVVGDNTSAVCSSSCVLAEGLAAGEEGSGTGLTAELLSRSRVGWEIGSDLGLGFVFGFVFGLCLEFFYSDPSTMYDLLFLEVLLPLFLVLSLAPTPHNVIAAVYAVGFTT